MKAGWLALALLGCAALVVIALAAPERIHTVYMSAESDGLHQDDHKILGFVPYSTTRRDPNLHVTRDTYDVLRKAGIRNIPEAGKPDPVFGPLRMFHGPKTSYTLGFYLKKTPPADAFDFYARQLTKPARGPDTVTGTCPDGTTKLSFSVYKDSRGNLGRLNIDP